MQYTDLDTPATNKSMAWGAAASIDLWGNTDNNVATPAEIPKA